MASNINRVVLGGRLTRDPETRTTAGGTTVLGFGVASNESTKNAQTGQWEDYANFVDCTMFGKRAESLANILRKGMKVVIEGRLHYSAWERDGQKRSKLEVIVDQVELPPANQGQQAAPSNVVGYQGQVVAPAPADQIYDEEIPF